LSFWQSPVWQLWWLGWTQNWRCELGVLSRFVRRVPNRHAVRQLIFWHLIFSQALDAALKSEGALKFSQI
jgi:hypothetical protein